MRILEIVLKQIHIRYTKSYCNKVYNENPYKTSLWGLVEMLHTYGIETSAYNLSNLKIIKDIEDPAIIQYRYDFYVIIPKDGFFILLGEKEDVKLTFPELIKSWTGTILFLTDVSKAKEPEYEKHRNKEVLDLLLRALTLFALVIFLMEFVILQKPSLSQFALIISNVIAFLVTLPLLHIHHTTNGIKAICGFLSPNGCSKVSSSKAGTILNIPLAEIGLSFFGVNLLCCIFTGKFTNTIYGIYILLIPFYFWSLIYQKTIVHSWCTLCVLDMCINLVVCLLALYFGVHVEQLTSYVFLLSLYMIAVFVTHKITILYRNRINLLNTISQFRDMKYSTETFCALLEKSDKVENVGSQIVLGGQNNQNTITLVLNPLCNPCAHLYCELYEKNLMFLSKYCKLNILWISFKGYEDCTRLMIYEYFIQKDKTPAFYYRWFKEYRYHYKELIEKNKNNIKREEVIDEFEKHHKSGKNDKIKGTPEVLINGYILPKYYNINDLVHFADMFNI